MILAIDCSKGLNILIFKNKKIYFMQNNKNIKNISEILINRIEIAFKKIDITYVDIKKIIIISGPGSFTGIRSSITFAKMLSLSLSVPIYGFSKFDIINLMAINKKENNKTIFLYNNYDQFYKCQFDNKNIQASIPELITLGKNIKPIKIKDDEQIIADNHKIYEFCEINSANKKHTNIAIFNFKIDILLQLPDNKLQKNFIPKPIYVKNFY